MVAIRPLVRLPNAQKVTQVTSVAHSKKRDWRRAHGPVREGLGRERRKDAVSTTVALGSTSLVSLRGSLAEAGEQDRQSSNCLVVWHGMAWCGVVWVMGYGVVETLEGGTPKAGRCKATKGVQQNRLWWREGFTTEWLSQLQYSTLLLSPPKISRPRMVSGISAQNELTSTFTCLFCSST